MDSDDKLILKILIPILFLGIYGAIRLFSDLINLFI